MLASLPVPDALGDDEHIIARDERRASPQIRLGSTHSGRGRSGCYGDATDG